MVPDEYISHFEPIAKRRVILAAHRLAYMIETVFDREWKEEVIQKEVDTEEEEKPSKFTQTYDAYSHFLSTLYTIWFE